MERVEGKLNNLVLDSSVIIKWFSKEEHTDKALLLRKEFLEGKIIIAVPDLQLYEIANALRYNKDIKEEEVTEAIESLVNMGLKIVVPTKEVIKSSINIAFKYNITVYDSYFVALAQKLNFDLVTSDSNLYGKIKTLSFVKLLENIP